MFMMRLARKLKEQEEGFALVTGVFILLILTMISITVVQLSAHNANQSAYDRNRLQAVNAHYLTAGENIAWSTNPSMVGINTMFMNSPDHRANILKGAFHQVGIGVASNGAKTMVVEVFSN